MSESEAALAAQVAAMERLQELSTLLVGDEAPQAIYEAIVHAAADLVGSDKASIHMLDRGGVCSSSPIPASIRTPPPIGRRQPHPPSAPAAPLWRRGGGSRSMMSNRACGGPWR